MESPTHFSLSARSLKLDTANDIDPHLKPLHSPSSNKPTTLSLNGNTLGVSACEALAETLKEHPQLESANFADIFTSRLLSEVPPALSSILTACLELPKLQKIDLSDNAFGLNTVEPLVHFLERHTPLRHLVLQNNGLGPTAGTKVADALTTLAERKEEARRKGGDVPLLETVICGRNRLESGSMSAWAKAVTAHAQGLRTLKMVQNGIRQEGIKILLEEGLINCEGLKVLDLQDNTFTITGARALVAVLGKWKEIQELGVGDCLLGGRGSCLVAKELGKKGVGEKLEILRAQFNDMDSKGVKELFIAADKDGLPKLRRVELNGNKFSEDDEAIEDLRVLLDKRKSESSPGAISTDEEWGLDDLSDLEEEDSEDEDDNDDENDDDEKEEDGEDEGKDDDEKEDEKDKAEAQEAKREAILKDADEAENSNVAAKKDDDVDALADKLGATHV